MTLTVSSNMPKDFNYKALIPIGGAVIFAGVAGYLYYKLLKKEEVDEKYEDLPYVNILPFSTIEFKIPPKVIGAIIGRQGSNIKRIQESTSTLINFRDEENGDKMCIIKGKLEKAEKAKELVLNAIKEIPNVETEEMIIPDKMIGRIIGRNGEIIRHLQRLTGAKIQVCSRDSPDATDEGSVADESRKIILKGTKEEIASAKLKIFEKIEDEERLRTQINASACNISQRSRGTRHQSQNGDILINSNSNEPADAVMSSTTFNEVYVSAVASGAHFWVQVVGPKTVQLDKLVAEMSEYYEDAENRENHLLPNFESDQIVAAKFNDGNWYRGRINFEERDKEQNRYTVYFVDFGDTDNVDKDDICSLRTDLLKLGFQAIECYLANVDLESATHEDAANAFETLTYAAQWKPLMVRVMGYKRDGKDFIPLLKVVDANGSNVIDVAEELIKMGLVKRLESNDASTGLTLLTET